MKNLHVILTSIILLVISFFVGQYIYKIGKVDKQILALSEKTNNMDINNNIATKLTTATNSVKISPNALIIFKTTYEKCGHTLNKYEIASEEIVNLTQEELEKKYDKWEITYFSEKEVVLLKKVNESCKQHYVIKEKGGYLAVYLINDNNVEELKETTGISTEYLTEIDLSKLKEGIKVNGLEELNSKLEDFE